MMTKQQYITSKTYNPLDVVYHYYVTHPSLNHKPLPPQELFNNLQFRGWNLNKIIGDVMSTYDQKFELTALLDRNGNFIKYL
jgi:hypothetical protein